METKVSNFEVFFYKAMSYNWTVTTCLYIFQESCVILSYTVNSISVPEAFYSVDDIHFIVTRYDLPNTNWNTIKYCSEKKSKKIPQFYDLYAFSSLIAGVSRKKKIDTFRFDLDIVKQS